MNLKTTHKKERVKQWEKEKTIFKIEALGFERVWSINKLAKLKWLNLFVRNKRKKSKWIIYIYIYIYRYKDSKIKITVGIKRGKYIYIYIFFWEPVLFFFFECKVWNKILSFFFLESFNLWHPFLMIAPYHQTKLLISFWCRQWLNFRSLIQSLETLPIKLLKPTNKILSWLCIKIVNDPLLLLHIKFWIKFSYKIVCSLSLQPYLIK